MKLEWGQTIAFEKAMTFKKFFSFIEVMAMHLCMSLLKELEKGADGFFLDPRIPVSFRFKESKEDKGKDTISWHFLIHEKKTILEEFECQQHLC